MDNDIAADGKHSRRDRIMGKLFGGGSSSGRERKLTHEESANQISNFLGGADRLTVNHPIPAPPPYSAATSAGPPTTLPTLALDTSRATRYPAALDVESRAKQNLAYRARSHSPPRPKKKKGLIVRFSDTYPEIIGEGGDECETVVAEIGRRKRSKSVPLSAPIPPTKQGHEYARQIGAAQEVNKVDDGFIPGPIRRTQTGLSTSDFRLEEPGPQNLASPEPPKPRVVPAGEAGRSRFLDTNPKKDENRRSFIEIHQQEQRKAEAMAFAEARSASANSHHEWEDGSSPEPVRETPPRYRQQPPPSSQDAGSPPSRGYSVRQPPIPALAPSPMRAQTMNRSPLPAPPSSSDGLAPTPPPRSAARTSPLQRQVQAVLASPDEPPRLPPLADQEDLRINTNVESSPSSVYSGSIYSTSDLSHKQTPITQTPITQTPTSRLAAPGSPEHLRRKPSDAVPAANDDALDLFNGRTKHLYELFRLYAEQLRSLETCRPEELCRGALWWFLKGRSALELAIRIRPANPDDTKHLMARYQAYTDLAKGFWLAEVALAEIAGGKYSPVGAVGAELGEVRSILISNLRKLAVSMKRNGLLPPEEPFLPQTMDKSVWIEYPAISQDIIALLNGISGSVLAVQQPARSMDLLEALPLGDTSKFFNYGRVPADVYLMEMGTDSKQMYFPCLVSILRPQSDQNIMFVIASQNGTVSLRIQSDKNAGATWQDVKWRPDACSLEVKLPRGFMLAIQCTKQDYGMLWSIYDFATKVQGYLYPRKEETVTYNTVLRGFHYLDANPKSRSFPNEPVGQCELGVYERLLKEGSPHGPRTFHRGFRIAVVTGPRTRTLSGVTQFFSPQQPIHFTFLRGDQRAPLLQLEFNDEKNKGRMVMTFKDDNEREKMLKLLNGTFVHHDEEIVAEVPLEGMNMSESMEDTRSAGFPAIQRLPWQRCRIINDRYAGDTAPTVLAEKLRIEVESLDKGGVGVVSTITDRVNVAPGEVRLRLGTKDILTLQVLRQPQQDMTVSVSDSLAPQSVAREFQNLQNTVARRPTVRTYRFNSFKDLHAFQAGLTGYTVLFDGIASTLNISRRRMVVPIHKKWDAGTTRIQVVQQDKTIQLLAFFEDWHHGQCMGFVLKGTDVFESINRNGKVGLKLCEAKFPLPRVAPEGTPNSDDMAFLCLDMPDYAGENDDVSILFEDSAERDRLCSVLPAPVKGSRRSMVKT